MTENIVWKILLVDDDGDDYLLTREMLSLAHGKEITLQWAASLEAGRQALKTEHFDAALIDYDLGEKTGLDLIREMDPENYPAPLMLLTGRGSYEVDLEAMQAGATLYLTKSEINPLLLDRSIRYSIERKQSEIALKETRRELEKRAHEAEEGKRILDALLEFIPEGITIASAPDIVTLKTSRYGDETLLGGEASHEGFTIPEWLANVEHYLADGVTPATDSDLPLVKVVRTGQKVEGQELILRRPNGEMIPVLCNAGPIRDEAGKITGAVVAWRDISDRKQIEQDLKDANALLEKQAQALSINNQQLQGMFDNAQAGLTLFDAEPPYKVLAHNRVYQEFWPEPYRSQGMVGKYVPEFAPRAEEDGVLEVYREAARTGQTQNIIDFPYDGMPQGRTWWSWSLAPIFENGVLKSFFELGIETTQQVLLRQRLEAELAERKRAEEVLSQQSKLIELSYEPIFIYDLQEGIVTWNQGCEQLYGYSKAEALGRTSHDLLQTRHPISKENFLAEIQRQGFWTGELQQHSKDGHILIVESRQQLVETGGRQLVLETNRDVTARKQAEQTLLVASSQVESMARFPEENPNPVVRVSTEGVVLYANPVASRPNGWGCSVGKPIDAVFLPFLTEAAAQGKEIIQDTYLLSGFYSVSIIPILEKGYFNIYGRDIMKRKLIEDALIQSEVRWSTTLASIGDAVLATDTAGNVTYMNPVAEQLTGWTLAEAQQKPAVEIFRIINEDTRQTITGPVSGVLESGAGVSLANHTMLVRRDGTEVAIDDSGAPIRDEAGKVHGAVLVFRDITQRKIKDRQLARLSRLYATLSQVNETIIRTQSAENLYSEMCEIVVRAGFPLVWIGEVNEGQVLPAAQCGPAAGYLNGIRVTVDGEFGAGPTGTCIRENRTVINPDFAENPSTLPWRAAALQFGIRSSAAFPLRRQGKPVGALTLYASEPNQFDAQQVALLEQMSSDISYALDALDQEHFRIQADHALRGSEERYRSLFNGINEGFALHEIVCDAEGKPCDFRFLDINPAFEKLTGLERTAVIGRLHNEVLPGDDPYWIEVYGKVALGGDPVHFENYSPALQRHYEVFAYRPAPRQFAVLFMNITERKQMEEKLRLSENRYRSLFESMHEGFYLAHTHFDENGSPCDFEYIDVNPAFEKIMGLKREQIIGHTAGELVPGIKPEWLQIFSAVEQTGEPGYYSTYSDIFSQYFEAFAFRPAAGQFAVVVTDISERKKAEDALHEADRLLKKYASNLERSNRELQDFASIASHDLQEPLRKVKSFGDLLQAHLAGKLDEQEQNFLDRMVNAAGRMQELINSLLLYSRVTTKAQPPRLVDLGALTAEVVSSLDVEFERNEGQVEVKNLPQVEADPIQMRQLMQNLLTNALKFHRPGVPPVIRVTGQEVANSLASFANQPGDCVKIEVRDNGIGFDMKYLERIFQPFERLHGRGEFEGTGMGLAICKKIVERHHGTITANSILGEGTTVTILLPRKQNG